MVKVTKKLLFWSVLSFLYSIPARSQNQVIGVDDTTYPCSAAGMNSAIAALPTKANGIVDARKCFSGIAGQTTTVSVGNGTAQYGVTLLLPSAIYSGSANPLFFVNIRSRLVTEPGTIIQQTSSSGNGVIVAGVASGVGLAGGIDGRGTIQGPGSSKSTGTGLILGGSSDPGNSTRYAANYVSIGPITIAGFALGELVANNVYLARHEHTQIYDNVNPMSEPSSTSGSAENTSWDHVQFGGNGSKSVGTIMLDGGPNGVEDSFKDCSLDGVVVNINGRTVVRAFFETTHFELTTGLGSQTADFITTSGGAGHFVVVSGGEFVEDVRSNRTRFINHGVGNLRLLNNAFYPAEHLAQIVNATGTAATEIYGPLALHTAELLGGTSTGGTIVCVNNLGCKYNSGIATSAGVASASFLMYQLGLVMSNTAPTISSGFGTSAFVAQNNGTPAFTINVGGGGSATNGVIRLAQAASGWVVDCADLTTQSATVFITKQIASSQTTATIANFSTSGAQAPWAANDILSCKAMAR
jgi:hypothetical protein